MASRSRCVFFPGGAELFSSSWVEKTRETFFRAAVAPAAEGVFSRVNRARFRITPVTFERVPCALGWVCTAYSRGNPRMGERVTSTKRLDLARASRLKKALESG